VGIKLDSQEVRNGTVTSIGQINFHLQRERDVSVANLVTSE
jgi:hypothetical protein